MRAIVNAVETTATAVSACAAGQQHGKLRVAFLTPEFVSENATSGGLATYLARMVLELNRRGHEVEVFTLGTNEVTSYQGVRVESVKTSRRLPVRVVRKLTQLMPCVRVEVTVRHLAGAVALAESFRRRHAERPFDTVQSSNYGLAGFFLKGNGGVRHLVRCSSSRRLWKTVADSKLSLDYRLMDFLERRILRRADACYAPSRFLAGYFQKVEGLPVSVLRPPLEAEFECSEKAPCEVPERYLVHFGLLGERKGTDVVLRAARLMEKLEPGLRIVLVGNEARSGRIAGMLECAGGPTENVTWVGSMERRDLYRVVSGAVASVLPSRVDNLPNTVIESLGLGVPVIGSAGASIDELVTDGVNGLLVPVGDHEALAAAMLDAWWETPRWKLAAFGTGQFLVPPEANDPVEEFVRLACGDGTVSAGVDDRVLSEAVV